MWPGIKLKQVQLLPPSSLPSPCWVSQPLLSPSSIERTHIGSVWSPFNGHNLDMRGVSGLQSRQPRKKSETWKTIGCSLIARLRWCGVTVRLGEFMYQIMESPAITQMTVDGREIWLIVLTGLGSVHNLTLNRTPLGRCQGTWRTPLYNCAKISPGGCRETTHYPLLCTQHTTLRHILSMKSYDYFCLKVRSCSLFNMSYY